MKKNRHSTEKVTGDAVVLQRVAKESVLRR